MNKSKNNTISSSDIYITISLFASIVYLSIYFYYYKVIDIEAIYSSVFIISNFYYFAYFNQSEIKNAYPSVMNAYFLIQSISLQGIAFELGINSVLYLSLIPLYFSAFYFYQKTIDHKDKFKYFKQLSLINIAHLVFLMSVNKYQLVSVKELIVFSTMNIWLALIAYYFSSVIKKEGQSLIYTLLRRLKESDKEDLVSKHEVDSMFYHDMINQTHGVCLLLEHKIDKNVDLSVEESSNILTEIKLFQSLLKDHFNLGHKNLNNDINYSDFYTIRSGIVKMITNFLSSSQISVHYIFEGDLRDDQGQKDIFINYPVFHRIMNNLVKNISETSSSSAEFIFHHRDCLLNVEIKNNTAVLSNIKNDLDIKLKEVISNTDFDSKLDNGIGLKSVQELIKQLEGEFNLTVENNMWIVKFSIPTNTYSEVESQNKYKIAS